MLGLAMRIRLHKTSDERHGLEILRDKGEAERVECESRSVLLHDFLHFAVEQSAGLEGGFWGQLARGKTLAEMNDRMPPQTAHAASARDELMDIERVVGALTPAAKGRSSKDVFAAIGRYFADLEVAVPPWLDEQFVSGVQERLRRLLGMWKATPYGGVLDLEWPVEG